MSVCSPDHEGRVHASFPAIRASCRVREGASPRTAALPEARASRLKTGLPSIGVQ
jgi:hypothetical protein